MDVKAVEDLKKLARMFKCVSDVAEDLEQLASLEQAIHECQSRLVEYRAEEQSHLDKHMAIKHEAEKAVVAAADARVKIECANEKARVEAQKEAAQIVEKAKAEALVILTGVKKQELAASDNVMKLKAQMKVLSDNVAVEHNKFEAIKKEMAAFKAKLA